MKGRLWSEADVLALHELRDARMTHAKIAETLGRSPQAIAKKIEKEGLGRHRKDPWDADDVAFMRKHYVEKGYRWMADMLGRSPNSVLYMAKRLKIQRRLPMAEPGS